MDFLRASVLDALCLAVLFLFFHLIFKMGYIRLSWLPARFDCVLSICMLYHELANMCSELHSHVAACICWHSRHRVDMLNSRPIDVNKQRSIFVYISLNCLYTRYNLFSLRYYAASCNTS